MAYIPRIPARVDEQGQLRPADPVAWRSYLARNKGRDVWVTVKRQTKHHSDSQRSYYHGVVVDMIANEIGESHEDTHELLKEKFCPRRQVELLNGKFLEMPPSTKNYSTEEYTAHIEKVRQWAASFLGLSIPDPNEVEVAL